MAAMDSTVTKATLAGLCFCKHCGRWHGPGGGARADSETESVLGRRRPSDGAPSLARDGTSAAPLRRRNLFELPAQGPGRSPLSLCHGHTGLRRPGLNQAGSGGLSDSARPRRGPAIMRQRVWRIWPVAPGPPPGRRRGRAPSPVHSGTGTVRVP